LPRRHQIARRDFLFAGSKTRLKPALRPPVQKPVLTYYLLSSEWTNVLDCQTIINIFNINSVTRCARLPNYNKYIIIFILFKQPNKLHVYQHWNRSSSAILRVNTRSQIYFCEEAELTHLVKWNWTFFIFWLGSLFVGVSADFDVVLQLGLRAARPQGGHNAVVELSKKIGARAKCSKAKFMKLKCSFRLFHFSMHQYLNLQIQTLNFRAWNQFKIFLKLQN
jgi:hypothetical protein